MSRETGQPGKEAVRHPSEQQSCPRSGNTGAVTSLCNSQAEKAGEGVGNAEQVDRHRASRGGTGVARQSLFPGQPPMCPCWTRQERSLGRWAGSESRRQLDLHSLAAHQLQTRPPSFHRLQSRQRMGPRPPRGNSTLTWRGLAVAWPCHWHYSRNTQGQQLRMLAPYTTRRLPSASRRRSCGISVWPTGQRSVPSG